MIGQLIEGRYKLTDKLGQGGMSEVYRAEDIKTHQMVALKFLKERVTSRRVEDVLRFQREATSVAKLDHPGIVKVYATGEYNHTPYIAMELLEGESLDDLFKEKRSFSIEETIGIVVGISEVLNYVHPKGIIHRDLKPGNIILINHQVKVLDFGLAQLLELKEIKAEEQIIGTFGYISPEQAGIVHKPADERSDLYSLGIIFYELLTDQLPFKGKDIGTILHQQVAKEPLPPSKIRKDIPEVIEEIVMKLLKKDPEERYQTASGLAFDLKRFQKGDTSFPIATRDKLSRLTYRTRLIDRKEELAHLKELFNQAQAGQGKVCLIAGEAGRGKSRLVNELRSYVYERGGLFIEGKCFRQENKLPYQPFTEALNEYIKKIDYSPPQQKDKIITRIKTLLGELGRTIEKISPLIKVIIGESPPLVKLESERENRRFLTVASTFFRNISTPKEPLILYIDDLQWSDKGSLTLLEEITSEIKDSNLLLLGTYRDNEVTPRHKLIKLIKESAEKNYPLEEIKLSFFDQPRTNTMVSELLGGGKETLQEISSYIQEKSRGNPFFILEITRQLVEEEVLYYKENVWEINPEKLQTTTIPTNILDIVLHRIDALSQEEIEVLSYGAAIGREFSVELLFELIDKPQKTIINIVDQAVGMQLLEWKAGERGRLLFVHERIRGAFYKKMGKEKSQRLHLKIARAIEETNRENIEPVIFDLAHHYSEAGQKDKTLEYAPAAANKAKEGYANEEAIRYYAIAIDILEEKGQKETQEWIEAKEGLISVYLTTGNNDEAMKIAYQVLPLKETPLEKAKIYRQIGTACFKKGAWENCENSLAEGLSLLGEKIPRRKPQVIFSLIKELFIHILHCLFPKVFLHKEGRPVKPEYKEMQWCSLSLDWMYILSDIGKFIRSVLRFLNIGESKIGKKKEFGWSLAAYAGLCMSIPLFKRSIRYHKKAIKLREELNDEWGIAQSLQVMGYCYSWKGDYQKSIEHFQKSKDKFQKMGDMWEFGMVMNGLGYANQFIADYEKSIDSFNQYLETSRKIGDDYGISVCETDLSLAYTEKGEFAKAEEWGRKALALSEEKKIWYPNCFGNIHFGYLEIEKRNYSEAIEYLEKAKKLNEENTFLKDYTVYLYPHLAEAYIGQFTA
ncbi:MAG: protein kinase, partial [Candidatus Omnitrophota bacterium]